MKVKATPVPQTGWTLNNSFPQLQRATKNNCSLSRLLKTMQMMALFTLISNKCHFTSSRKQKSSSGPEHPHPIGSRIWEFQLDEDTLVLTEAPSRVARAAPAWPTDATAGHGLCHTEGQREPCKRRVTQEGRDPFSRLNSRLKARPHTGWHRKRARGC